jgi:hypothetical protein
VAPGGGPLRGSPGGTFNAYGCGRFAFGCAGTPVKLTQAPGGSLGFLAGLGGSFVGLLDAGICAVSIAACLHDAATGNTFSGDYTRWAAAHGVDTSPHSTYAGGIWSGFVLQMGLGGWAAARSVPPQQQT